MHTVGVYKVDRIPVGVAVAVMEDEFANSIVNWTDASGEQVELGAACAAFIFADGPFPFGDLACLALVTIAGVAALVGVSNAARNIADFCNTGSCNLADLLQPTPFDPNRGVSLLTQTPPNANGGTTLVTLEPGSQFNTPLEVTQAPVETPVAIPAPEAPPVIITTIDVTIQGTPDSEHERSQAIRFGRIYGGGTFRFLGNKSQGIEGFFTPVGNIPAFPVSLKDFTETSRLSNIIGRINVNANQVRSAGYAGNTELHIVLGQSDANTLESFVNNGPIKVMPSEGVFRAIYLEGSDGIIVVKSDGVTRGGLP